MIPQKPITEPSEVDWARLAAYIDGEGSILVNRFPPSTRPGGKRYGQCRMWLRVIVVNTDPRLLLYLRDTFGGSVNLHQKPQKLNHKQGFKWLINCKQAARLLERCLPYFIIKREQAEIALAFQGTLRGPGVLVSPVILAERDRLRLELQALKTDHGQRNEEPTQWKAPEKTGPKPNQVLQ